MALPLWVVAAAVLVGNVPFGYWRGNVQKFSLQWALAIHVPVGLALLLRLATHLPIEPAALAVTAGAFFLGQAAGQRARTPLAARLPVQPSSCLVVDLLRVRQG